MWAMSRWRRTSSTSAVNPQPSSSGVALLHVAVAAQDGGVWAGRGQLALQPPQLAVQVVDLARRGVQVLGQGQVGPRRLLGEEAGGVAVAHGDAALVGRIEAGHDAQERRLAGTVRADEPDPLAVSEDERDVREERERIVRSGHTVAFQHGPSYLSPPMIAGACWRLAQEAHVRQVPEALVVAEAVADHEPSAAVKPT